MVNKMERLATRQNNNRPHPPRDGEEDGTTSDATKTVTGPIRLAHGEQDGTTSDATKTVTGPIRLARMVNKMERLATRPKQ